MAAASTPSSGATQRRPGRNRQLVFGALEAAGKPMGAYELLDALRTNGLRSPLQVYRALDQLIDDGSVHKIESLSAYALCSGTHCRARGHAVFAICKRCSHTTEIHEPALDRLLAKLADRQEFRIEAATVELSGLCEVCGSA